MGEKNGGMRSQGVAYPTLQNDALSFPDSSLNAAAHSGCVDCRGMH